MIIDEEWERHFLLSLYSFFFCIAFAVTIWNREDDEENIWIAIALMRKIVLQLCDIGEED